MRCDVWQEAISARVDGERSGIDDRLVDAHLASCPDCRAFSENAHRLRRSATLTPAPALADIAGSIVRSARAHDRRSVWWVLRLALGVVAVQVIVLSLPALLLGHSAGSDEHAARHLGSFAVAYAVGLLVVALRPAKARGMLPLAIALAGCLIVTGIIDIADGHVPAVAEIAHMPEAIGLVLVWLLATPRRLPGTTSRHGLPRLVRSDEGRRDERRSS